MPAPAPAARALRFDTFELDLRAGELHKRGVKLRLQGQPLQVLTILLQSAGNLVTREELSSQLWPADTFVDFDHSLHNAIGRIREVLGDSAETPRYIETLPRRGYRFIAPVEEVQAPRISEANGNKTREAVTVAPPTARRKALAVILSFCAAIGLTAWAAWRHFYVKSPVPAIRSLAVLPMQNLSGDAAQEYFADGMTEELITDLAKVSALRVISRTSVMRYKGTKKGLPEIARELNVDGIVEGSVMRSGNRVRITAQLLHVKQWPCRTPNQAARSLSRAKRPQQLHGLNKNHNHDLKNIFKSAATMATISAGPFHDFYEALLVNGRCTGSVLHRV